jgi:DNA-directed RNA polymerase subunit RPC12/RpoP
MQQEGIKCWLKDENTVTVTPIFTNAVGGVKLMVAKEQLVMANELLHQFREEKKSKLACPYCGSHDIELIPSRKPLNLLGAIATWIIGRYAISTDSVWHCFHCNKEFTDPDDTSTYNNEADSDERKF